MWDFDAFINSTQIPNLSLMEFMPGALGKELRSDEAHPLPKL
jgi:hypothetical protein